jgi:hypothetical protein
MQVRENYHLCARDSEDIMSDQTIHVELTAQEWSKLIWMLQQCISPTVSYRPENPATMESQALIQTKLLAKDIAVTLQNSTRSKWLQGELNKVL